MALSLKFKSLIHFQFFLVYNVRKWLRPDRGTSVGWAFPGKVKGQQFDSWSEYMPGLWVQSQGRAHTRGNLVTVSLSH